MCSLKCVTVTVTVAQKEPDCMVEMLTEDVAAAFAFGPKGSVTLELASSGAYVDASEPGAFVKPQTTSPSLSVTQGMGGTVHRHRRLSCNRS